MWSTLSSPLTTLEEVTTVVPLSGAYDPQCEVLPHIHSPQCAEVTDHVYTVVSVSKWEGQTQGLDRDVFGRETDSESIGGEVRFQGRTGSRDEDAVGVDRRVDDIVLGGGIE